MVRAVIFLVEIVPVIFLPIKTWTYLSIITLFVDTGNYFTVKLTIKRHSVAAAPYADQLVMFGR